MAEEFIRTLKAKGITLNLENDNLKIQAPKGALSDDVLAQIKSQKSDILTFLKSSSLYQTIGKVDDRPYYPLSSSQLLHFILQQTNPLSKTYNIPQLFELHAEVPAEKLRDMLQRIVDVNEILRTSFHDTSDGIVQKVADTLSLDVQTYQIREGEVNTLLESLVQPFALDTLPLIRAAAVITPHKKFFFLDMHHIISDGVSNKIILEQLCQLNSGAALQPSTIQYKDYAVWQQESWLQSIAYKNQLKYWEEILGDSIPLLSWPTDRPRTKGRDFRGSKYNFSFPSHIIELLQNGSHKYRVTMNNLLFSVYALYVGYYCDRQSDKYYVGTLLSGRTRPGLDSLVGNFVNYLPILISVSEGKSFEAFMFSINEKLLLAYENQEVPFEKLVSIGQKYPIGRNPFFDTMMVYHANEKQKTDSFLSFAGFLDNHESKLDLKLDVYEHSKGIDCTLEYSTGLFDDHSMKAFASHFMVLAERVLRNPEKSLDDLIPFDSEHRTKLQRKILASNPSVATESVLIAPSFTADLLKKQIEWWSEQYKKPLSCALGPYNQIFQQLADPESSICKNSGINVILLNFHDWLRDADPSVDVAEILQQNFTLLKALLANARFSGKILMPVLPVPDFVADNLQQHLLQLQNELLTLKDKLPSVFISDCRQFPAQFAVEDAFDELSEREGNIPYTEAGFAALGAVLFREIVALQGYRFKVIAVDCDNTLWSGICGEDGNNGINITDAHQQFQRFLVSKAEQGFLIVLVSKNNEHDVWEVFSNNARMILKKEHVTAWRINWMPKSSNIASLASQLNLGIDSFIFIDDSIHECREVTQQESTVLTLQFPTDPGAIRFFVERLWMLDKARITREDGERTLMYAQERERKDLQEKHRDNFVAQLGLEVYVALAGQSEMERVSQMTFKTNQFNLSTKRRTVSEIKELQKEGSDVIVVHVKDRFGDYGLCGLMIVNQQGTNAVLDTLLLSCRALGRMVENFLLDGLVTYAIQNKLSRIIAPFEYSNKNMPMLEFLKQTFNIIQENDHQVIFDYEISTHQNRPENLGKLHYMQKPAVVHKSVTLSSPKATAQQRPANNPAVIGFISAFNRRMATAMSDMIPFRYLTADEMICAQTHGDKYQEILVLGSVLKEHADVTDIAVPAESFQSHAPMQVYFNAPTSMSTLRMRKLAVEHKVNVPIACFIRVSPLQADDTGKIMPGTIASATQYVDEFSSDFEQSVAALWKQILGVRSVRRHDNFFDLGGNSLLMIRLMSALNKQLGVQATINDFFNQSLGQFTEALKRKL